MNDRENDKMRETEGRQIQQELENQMRAFGDTVSDAFAHGFEGRGMEIGDRAWGVGKAAVHAAKHIFGLKNEQTPVELLRADGKKGPDAGVALLVALSELVRAPALPSVTQASTTHCAREAL